MGRSRGSTSGRASSCRHHRQRRQRGRQQRAGEGQSQPDLHELLRECTSRIRSSSPGDYINLTQTPVTARASRTTFQLPPSHPVDGSRRPTGSYITLDNNWATAFTSVRTSAITAHTYYPLVGRLPWRPERIIVTVDGRADHRVRRCSAGQANWTYQATSMIVFNPNTGPAEDRRPGHGPVPDWLQGNRVPSERRFIELEVR